MLVMQWRRKGGNGERKDRNKKDRKHDKPTSDILQEKKWFAEKGL